MDAVEAVRAGSRAALDQVFRKGGDLDAVDKNGATPLIAAAETGRLDLLKFLLQCGVSLNAQDKFGQTALMVAAGKGDVYSVKHGRRGFRSGYFAGGLIYLERPWRMDVARSSERRR
jgi:ankyrin repeat protein